MWRYILKRLLWMFPVILGVIFIVFSLLQLTPGDPARVTLGTEASEERLEEWREEHGLNKSFFAQYVDYVRKVVTKLDFGNSYTTNRPILDEISARLPKSLTIAFLAILVMTILGVPVGIISALHPYTWKDNVLMTGALVLVSMPGFWLGLMLSILFALKLGWLPASGLYGPVYYILPVSSLALQQTASIARLTRSCMLDVIGQDYIVTAKAKGVAPKSITYKHALRNALIPIITSLGGSSCMLLGGSMITETVFSIPGMGTMIVNAIKGRDSLCAGGGAGAVDLLKRDTADLRPGLCLCRSQDQGAVQQRRQEKEERSKLIWDFIKKRESAAKIVCMRWLWFG